MNRLDYFNFIESKLSELATRIEVRGGLNLLDLHLHSEDFYQHLVNLIFNWELENVNTRRHNMPGIDLKDTTNKIVVQVSSTATQVKVESALSKLSGYEDYSFKFISISKDAKDLRTKSFANPHNVKFVPSYDILDIKSLLAIIKNLPVEKLLAVYEFLEKELRVDTGRDNEWRERILLIVMVVIAIGSLGVLISYQYTKFKKFSGIRFKQDTVHAQNTNPDTIQKKFLIYKLGEKPISSVTLYFGILKENRQFYEITNAQVRAYEKSVLHFFVEPTYLPSIKGTEVGPDADSPDDPDSKRSNLYVYVLDELSPDYVYELTVTLRKKESGPEGFIFKLIDDDGTPYQEMKSGDYIRIYATELLTVSMPCLLLFAFGIWKTGDRLLGIRKRRVTLKLRAPDLEDNSLSGLVVLDGNERALTLPSGWRICLRTQTTDATLVNPPPSPVAQDGNFRINGVRSGPVSFRLYSTGDNQEQFEILRVERDGIPQPETIDVKEGEHVAGIRVIVKSQPNPKPSSKLWVAPTVILCFVGLAPGTIAQNPGSQPSPSPAKEGTVTGYVKVNDAKGPPLLGARVCIETGKNGRGKPILKRVSTSKKDGDYNFNYAIGFQVLVIEKEPFYENKTIPGVNIQLAKQTIVDTTYLNENPKNIGQVVVARNLISRGYLEQGSKLVSTLVGLCKISKESSARYSAPRQFTVPIRFAFSMTTSVQRPASTEVFEDPECELIRLAQAALLAGDSVAAASRLDELLSLLPAFNFRARQSVYIIAFRDTDVRNSVDPRMLRLDQSLDAERKVTKKTEEWGFFRVVKKPSEADFVFLVHLDEHSVEALALPLAAYEQHYRENFDLELLRDNAYERYQVGPLKLATLSRLTDRLVKQFRQKTISGK